MAKTTFKTALCLLTALCAFDVRAQINPSDFFLEDDFYDEFSKLTPGQFTASTHDFSGMSSYANLIAPESSVLDFIGNVKKTTGDYRVFDLCGARNENTRNDVAMGFLLDTSLPGDVLGAVALCAPSGVLRACALKRLEERNDPLLISIAAAVCPYEKTRTRAFESLYASYLEQKSRVQESHGRLSRQNPLGPYYESLGVIAAISGNITQRDIALDIILRENCPADGAHDQVAPAFATDGLRSYLMHTQDEIKGKHAFEVFLGHETTTLQDIIEVFIFHKGSVDFYNRMIEWFVSPVYKERVKRLMDESEFSVFDAPENPEEVKALIKFVKKIFFP